MEKEKALESRIVISLSEVEATRVGFFGRKISGRCHPPSRFGSEADRPKLPFWSFPVFLAR
jgi:hypothetical protein